MAERINDLLCLVALVLMCVTIVVSFLPGTARCRAEHVHIKSVETFFSVLGVSGIVILCGGFWVDWMLFAGIILIETGCIFWSLTRKSD